MVVFSFSFDLKSNIWRSTCIFYWTQADGQYQARVRHEYKRGSLTCPNMARRYCPGNNHKHYQSKALNAGDNSPGL